MRPRWPCALWAVLAACAGAPDADDPAGEPGFESSDDVVLGDAVVCAAPVDGFDRLSPSAADLGIEHIAAGPAQLRLGQSGVVARDLDGDGDIDLALGATGGDFPIWANDGDGGFERVASPGTLDRFVLRHAAADLTGDGLPELIFVGAGQLTWRENLGGLAWGPAREAWRGPESHLAASLSLGDADGDGDLDVVVPGLFVNGAGGDAQDRVFQNEGGDFALVESWPEEGDKAMSVVALWTDRDDDGDADLFLASHRDFVATPPNFFYRNDGPANGWATLTEDAAEIGWAQTSSPMGIDSADLNGDEVLDYCTTDTGPIKCFLSGGGVWAEGGEQLGLAPPGDSPGDWSAWSIDLVDVDVDGVLDVAVAAAFADITNPDWPDHPDGLWQGTPGGFVDRASAVGFDDASGRYGLASADLFGDGYPEIVTAGFEGVEVWNNPCGSGAWLDLKLVGPAANVDAFGARLTARAGDLVVVRELHNSRGPSQGPARFHLGLGAVSLIDEIFLRWPDGHETLMQRVPTNRSLTVMHPSAPELARERR